MIKNRTDLKLYLFRDCSSLHKRNLFLKWLSQSEEYYPIMFMHYLRYTEYYMNKTKRVWDYIPYIWCLYQYRRLKKKTGFYIMPNTVGAGFNPVHPGFIRISADISIGDNCTILPMVLIGKAKPGLDMTGFSIGDNCYISTGVTILGPITIGNNVTIAAGAVVTRDVPDNVIVGGVPAKIIKYKQSFTEKMC